jgi:RNA polymerase sigma-70 factor (ECF subfamily)
MALRLRRQPNGSSGDGGEQFEDEDAIVLRAVVDRREFAPLYERYLDAIYGYCHRRLGENEAAEDLTALVFRKALEGLHSYHGGSFRAWLYTIADNVLRDAARSRRPTTPYDDHPEWLDPAPGPEDLAIAAFDRQQLRCAIAELPEEWQRVVALRNEGFACAEIAGMLGSGRTTEWVRQIHHRAMLRLREILTARPAAKGGAR